MDQLNVLYVAAVTAVSDLNRHTSGSIKRLTLTVHSCNAALTAATEAGAMASKRKDPIEQHLVRRSFLFAYFPIILLVALGANFIWEAVRMNVEDRLRTEWPLRFTLLNVSTTVTVLALVTGLYLTRLQWAKANRPTIGYVIADPEGNFVSTSDRWNVWIHNGGPGIGVVEEFAYFVRFTNSPRSARTELDEMNRVMRERGLVSGTDYFIRELGRGAALPVTTSYVQATLICWFTIKALAELADFDVAVRFKDGLGDEHQRTLEIFRRLPDIAINARTEYIENRKQSKT